MGEGMRAVVALVEKSDEEHAEWEQNQTDHRTLHRAHCETHEKILAQMQYVEKVMGNFHAGRNSALESLENRMQALESMIGDVVDERSKWETVDIHEDEPEEEVEDKQASPSIEPL